MDLQDIKYNVAEKTSKEERNIGHYKISPGGEFIDADDNFLKILNYTSLEDLSTVNINQIRIFLNMDEDRYLVHLKEKGYVNQLQSSWFTSSGNVVYLIEQVNVVRNNKGEIRYFESIVDDISDKKLAETQLNLLNTIFSELGTDPEINIHTIVKKTCQILLGTCSLYNRLDDKSKSLLVWSEYNAPQGYEKKDSAIGHICYEATIKGKHETIVLNDLAKSPYYESDPNIKKYELKSYLGHPVMIDGEARGSLCIVDTRPRNFTVTEKKIIKTLAIALSLEHRRYDLEKNLETALHDAENANRAKNQFLANMSHEIRTPLNGIMGFSEMLINEEKDPRKKRMLEMIEESGRQLLGIINDILDYSNIENSKITLNERNFNLNHMLENLIYFFKPKAVERGLTLVLDKEDLQHPELRGDQYKLNQVLVNIIGNAVKFTEEGTVFIVAKTSLDNERVNVTISVEDTGIGIGKEQLESIFDDFKQLEFYLTKRIRGTGLGLAISKKLIDFLDGRINVESEPGKGSRFELNFQFDQGIIQNTKVSINKDSEQKKPNMGKKNILLAEDNESNQFLIKAITKSENYNITVVDDGEKAVEEYKKNSYDLILMDVQMPVMNGYEATRIIRDLEKSKEEHTPIIALTAYAMKSDKDLCIEAGMDDYISKPFKRQQFLDAVAHYLHQND